MFDFNDDTVDIFNYHNINHSIDNNENSFLAREIEEKEVFLKSVSPDTEDNENLHFLSKMNEELGLSLQNNQNNNSLGKVKNMVIEIEKKETKKANTEKKHTKYDDDNMRRKCKHLVLDSVFNHINNMIRKLYNNNIGQGILSKQLRTLNKTQKSEGNIKFNKEFLYKNIGEIFSDKISGRITNYPPDINKYIIQNLLNEKDRTKNIFFNNLFSLTFFECLEHFRGTKYFPALEGMDNLKKSLEEYQNDPDYASNIDYYINAYEIILNIKKSRKKRQKKEKKLVAIRK